MRRKLLGRGAQETAVSLNDLASVLRLNGDLTGAETLLRQALAINRKTRGDDHPNTAITVHDLALIAAARGDYARRRVDAAPGPRDTAQGARREARRVVAATFNSSVARAARTAALRRGGRSPCRTR